MTMLFSYLSKSSGKLLALDVNLEVESGPTEKKLKIKVGWIMGLNFQFANIS